MPPNKAPIQALLPRNGRGHQLVCYADSCSGVPGALHESTFAAINAVVARLEPQPEFICFPGDEIIGLTAGDATLRRQWKHWFDVEMAWLDRAAIPLYHTTGNHTAYDAHSTALYQEVMTHLPQNGPSGQEGLSYFVRRGDLLLVFVNTLNAELGGEGFVETEWLAQVLVEQADARHKLVFGHHPVFSVNGFVGQHGRDVDTEAGQRLWALLVQHGVLAYVCSHILAFDVQVHEGVLQILTAGAGTAHRMPEGVEYLHAVQAALDDDGLRYQVLDMEGAVREWLAWPLPEADGAAWQTLTHGVTEAPIRGQVAHPDIDDQQSSVLSFRSEPSDLDGSDSSRGKSFLAGCVARFVTWQFSGTCSTGMDGSRQTLLSGWNNDGGLASLWIGFVGPKNRLTVSLAPTAGRSPHLWQGDTFGAGESFEFQLAIHTGMGPGGILWRQASGDAWTSLRGTAAWGAERLTWPAFWGVGHGQRGEGDAPFRGTGLSVEWRGQEIR